MTFRFLALGDSYTIGEGVAAEERWPVQLAEMLRAEDIDIADPEIIAATGWTTADLAEAIEGKAPAGPFDLVTLAIGVNDQYRGGTVEAFTVAFQGLLKQAVTLAGGNPFRVIGFSIPDWGVTPYAEGRDRAAIAAEVNEFSRAALFGVMSSGPHWVDVTWLSREAGSKPAMLAGDGLHPSGQAYEAWAKVALRPALAALGKLKG